MSAHDARFDDWDGAYVLGALSADDRRDYEEHLRSCERCRADVAEFGGLPGLLSRIEPERALALIDTDQPAVSLRPDPLTPPADLAARLHRRARQRRRRPLLVAAGAGIAAAVLAVVSVLGVQTLTAPDPTWTADLRPTAALGNDADLAASVRLYRKAWGTEVDTRCRHAHSSPTAGSAEAGESYGLYLVDAAGHRTLVSSWLGIPQSPITTTAATATQIEDIRRLELWSLQDQTVLLAAPVHG